MIHYTCDRCQRFINSEEELRFEINIVTEVKLDSGLSLPESEPRDLMDELNGLLGSAIDSANEQLFQTRRFDLCPDCYQASSSSGNKRLIGIEP